MTFKKGDELECVNAGANYLTNGKTYIAIEDQELGSIRVTNDEDWFNSYDASRFKLKSPDRLSQAKELVSAAEALEAAQKRYDAASAALNK